MIWMSSGVVPLVLAVLLAWRPGRARPDLLRVELRLTSALSEELRWWFEVRAAELKRVGRGAEAGAAKLTPAWPRP
jgi:hypothetical protein